VDVDDEGASRGPKKKTAEKSTVEKHNLFLEDKEEEGYTQRKNPTLSMWYLPVIQ
jgi:hypothetical protein